MNYVHSVWLRPVSLSVPRGGGNFKQLRPSNVAIENVASHLYLRGLCSQKAVYASPNPGLSFRAECSNTTLTNHWNNDEFVISDPLFIHSFWRVIHCSSSHKKWLYWGIDLWNSLFTCLFFIYCVLREDHHLHLQVNWYGYFARSSSGPKLYQFQLLPQVLQERGEGAPTSGGNNSHWVSSCAHS